MSFKAIFKLDVTFFIVVLMIIFIPRNILMETKEDTTVANNSSTTASTRARYKTSSSTVHSISTVVNSANGTSSSQPPQNSTKPELTQFLDSLGKNKDMLLRALYVLIAVTTIVIIYFGIKAWRVHRRKSKSRKYGIITKGADLEMEPLGKGDDDEEDMTVFEIKSKTKKK
ncbi:hypothetical protein ACJMK2_044598 [Sinanodonta woodiana]|uniref:Uncharacterized protein n=1 Tax=Sinanodonta woodiana TaxID=1069815 RepID=A0ABD3W0J2_SINWO